MRVTKAIKSIPGVREATVDLQKAEAVVLYDEAAAVPDKLKTAVNDAGYTVVS
jgi:copper chaperone CopZ